MASSLKTIRYSAWRLQSANAQLDIAVSEIAVVARALGIDINATYIANVIDVVENYLRTRVEQPSAIVSIDTYALLYILDSYATFNAKRLLEQHLRMAYPLDDIALPLSFS
jgi:hypothetical protein